MMRSLWTAASGMLAQQTNLDTIANNLSNINTMGYKTETTEFKSLLYQTIQQKTTDSDGNPKPVGAQVGLGVRPSAVTAKFTQGNLTATDRNLDFAIEGNGFFQIRMEDGSIAYTRNGAFQFAVGTDGMTLTNSDGNPVLDINGNSITLESGTYQTNYVTIDTSGRLMYPDATGNAQYIGYQIGLVQFNNPAGLDKIGGTNFKESAASGVPLSEANGETYSVSKLHQSYLEASNVQAVDEMVNMIVAQRAYEMNSKAITASDEMMQQANNLRR